MLETKTITVRGRTFVISELTIDDIEAWETGMREIQKGGATLTGLHAVQKKACAASLRAAGVTDPAEVGQLPPRALTELVSAVMAFSNMTATEGEAKGSP